MTDITARRDRAWSHAEMLVVVGGGSTEHGSVEEGLAEEGTAVALGESLGRRVRASSRRSGRSPEELIREAVADLLDTDEEYRLPSWVGAVAAGSAARTTS